MNKLFIFVLTLFFAFRLISAPISLEQAYIAANTFLKKNNLISDKSKLVRFNFNDKADSLLYIFNFDNKGFIIIAGDDNVIPVLGYSNESVFSGKDLPDSFLAMLESFIQQISYVRENSIMADKQIEEEWNMLLNGAYMPTKGYSVSQLLTCLWDQDFPYNFLCPNDNEGPGNRVYAGCVATAMAMVMYYYRYPVQPTGSHGYYSSYGYLSVDFSQSHYNYEQMPYKVSSVNYDAAKLQYDCGVAVDMMYSPHGSGAYMHDALNAMKQYFGYNQGATLEFKDNHSENEWINLLKSQLNAGYPMAYAGFDASSGHAFVCDGYVDNMFHFNWGWSGSFNGYFYINNLNPAYNFSTGQQAFINCYPAAATYPASCGNFQMTSNSGSLQIGHGLSGYLNNQNCSWLIEPQDSVEYIVVEFRYLRTEQENDVVTIHQGVDASAPIIGTYSGINDNFSVQVPGNRVFVTFSSNGSVTGNGFHADYYVYTPSFCSILDIRNDSAGIVNDGSNSYNYSNNSICRWRIEPENAAGIMINFSEFDLEQDYDFLTFYQYPSYVQVASFSGNTIPQSFFINSPRAMVVFKANESVTKSGFTFSYNGVATGIDESENASMFVFKNSANFPVVSISHFPADYYSLKMTDITGRVLYKSKMTFYGGNNQIEIPFSPEHGGLYLISIESEKISRTLKYFAK